MAAHRRLEPPMGGVRPLPVLQPLVEGPPGLCFAQNTLFCEAWLRSGWKLEGLLAFFEIEHVELVAQLLGPGLFQFNAYPWVRPETRQLIRQRGFHPRPWSLLDVPLREHAGQQVFVSNPIVEALAPYEGRAVEGWHALQLRQLRGASLEDVMGS